MGRFGLVLLVALVAMVGAEPPCAWGHTIKPDRQLVIQVDHEGVAALWQLTVGGLQAAVFYSTGDLNHDGTLSDAERVVLALSMLSKAVHGVVLSWDGVPVSGADLKPRLDGADRMLVAFGLTELKLAPATMLCAEHLLVVQAEAGAAPLGVDLRAVDGWRLEAMTLGGRQPATPFVQPVLLAPGERLEIRVRGSCEADMSEPR